MTPYKYNFGKKITTDVEDVSCGAALIAHFQVAADAATVASNTNVHAAVDLVASAKDVTTAITNPSVPRNIIIKGNAAGMTGNVVITGANYSGVEITETIALDGSNAVAGTKAFKTVTKIALPAKTNTSGDNVSVGTGEVLGLPYLLNHNTVLAAYKDNAKESTAPTVTTSLTAIESNTIDLNSALNSKVVDAYLIV